MITKSYLTLDSQFYVNVKNFDPPISCQNSNEKNDEQRKFSTAIIHNKTRKMNHPKVSMKLNNSSELRSQIDYYVTRHKTLIEKIKSLPVDNSFKSLVPSQNLDFGPLNVNENRRIFISLRTKCLLSGTYRINLDQVASISLKGNTAFHFKFGMTSR